MFSESLKLMGHSFSGKINEFGNSLDFPLKLSGSSIHGVMY